MRHAAPVATAAVDAPDVVTAAVGAFVVAAVVVNEAALTFAVASTDETHETPTAPVA